MKIKKILPYKIKKLLPILGLAGATTVIPSCDKGDDFGYISPKEEVTIKFSLSDFKAVVDMDGIYVLGVNDVVKYYINNPDTKVIYIEPTDTWDLCSSQNISGLRIDVLEVLLAASPKIRGKGNFNFRLGEASKVPEDSLWYVQHGWTINKQLQK